MVTYHAVGVKKSRTWDSRDDVTFLSHTTKNQTKSEAAMGDDTLAALGALRVDESKLRGHVDEVVRSSVEETLNGLLDAEADEICRAPRYERSAEWVDTRAGHYERKLEMKAGEVTLRVPKPRRLPFETEIIMRAADHRTRRSRWPLFRKDQCSCSPLSVAR